MTTYQIRVKGHLDPRWSAWFDGLAVTQLENGETILIGPLGDQAALHGVLAKVPDLGLELLSVNSAESESDEVIIYNFPKS
jgi:hypothetical protein